MTAVTERPVDLLNGLFWLQVTYDDVSLDIATLQSWNGTGVAHGRIFVWNSTRTLCDQTMPPGLTTINVPGHRAVTDYNMYATA